VKVGVCTENPARTMGLEKRIRSAVEKNGMNMLYSSIIQKTEGGEEGRVRESAQEATIK
jgi:hypothetical protein